MTLEDLARLTVSKSSNYDGPTPVMEDLILGALRVATVAYMKATREHLCTRCNQLAITIPLPHECRAAIAQRAQVLMEREKG